MPYEMFPSSQKIVLKQENNLRIECMSYLMRYRENGAGPLIYTPWRHYRIEPRALELLTEENQLNRNLIFQRRCRGSEKFSSGSGKNTGSCVAVNEGDTIYV